VFFISEKRVFKRILFLVETLLTTTANAFTTHCDVFTAHDIVQTKNPFCDRSAGLAASKFVKPTNSSVCRLANQGSGTTTMKEKARAQVGRIDEADKVAKISTVNLTKIRNGDVYS